MIYESQLYHHGIRGQKWGKRNGPPYPLDRKEARKQKREERKRIYQQQQIDRWKGPYTKQQKQFLEKQKEQETAKNNLRNEFNGIAKTKLDSLEKDPNFVKMQNSCTSFENKMDNLESQMHEIEAKYNGNSDLIVKDKKWVKLSDEWEKIGDKLSDLDETINQSYNEAHREAAASVAEKYGKEFVEDTLRIKI